MYIANNILKYNLKNVYFIGGTACGGKTTMGKALSKKYGFIHFDDNYHTDNFSIFAKLSNPVYQPACARVNKIRESWEDYFNKLAAGDDMLEESAIEHLQFMLLEIIKLSKDNIVVADVHLPVDLAKEITDYNKVAFLVTSPENVVKDFYHRDDHSDIYDLIMSFKEPQKSLNDLHIYLKWETEKFLKEVYESDLYTIMRDENSTVENTLSLLEKHFRLI